MLNITETEKNCADKIIVNKYLDSNSTIKNQVKFLLKIFHIDNYISIFFKKIRHYRLSKKYYSYMDIFLKDKDMLFTEIEIETVNRCNGSCPFCPVNKDIDSRQYKMMDRELFLSIISQLKELDYNGKIALFSNNEPFIDNRIVEFAKITKESLPNAYVYLYTNAILLTLTKFLDIIPYLDRIIIDNYNDELELNETTKILYEYCQKEYFYHKEKVEIRLRKLNEVLTTRGGQAPNNKKQETLKIPCILPYRQIIIRPDGKLSLCCNDALGKFTMGDLRKQTLLEIWKSDNYNEIRYKMKKGRKNLLLCQFCDVIPG